VRLLLDAGADASQIEWTDLFFDHVAMLRSPRGDVFVELYLRERLAAGPFEVYFGPDRRQSRPRPSRKRYAGTVMLEFEDEETARELLFAILARHAGVIDGPALMDTLGHLTNEPAPSVEPLEAIAALTPLARARVEGLLERMLETSESAVEAVVSMLDTLPRFIPTEDERRAILEILGGSAAAMRRTLVSEDPTPEADTTLALGLQPRYERRSLHAEGGMGRIWVAYDTHIRREVALKELYGDTTAAVSHRFLREAQITGQLEHPGVVPVYELGRDAATDRPYYAMRFVRGKTLADAIKIFHRDRKAGRDEPMQFVTLLTAFVSVCQTLAYAHSRGIVHRDLKGENVVLGDFGEVVLLDWGIAKRMNRASEEPWDPSEPLAENPMQTVAGQVLGTPAYMAPEQALGLHDQIGPATDIFGAGAVLYEILTGKPPFDGTDTAESLRQTLSGEIEPPHTAWPEVPVDLERICLQALARVPSERHASASELANLVQRWQDDRRRRAEGELRRAGERLMQQQTALVELTRSEVFLAPDLLEIMRTMVETSAKTLGVERVSVWRYLESGRTIRCLLLYERSTDRTSSGTELHKTDYPSYFDAMRVSEVIAAHDARNDPRTCEFTASYLEPLGIGAIMDAPILVAGRLYGVVCHEHVGSARRWAPDEQLFAIAIANLVAQAVSQAEYTAT